MSSESTSIKDTSYQLQFVGGFLYQLPKRISMSKKIAAVVFDLYGTLMHLANAKKIYPRLFSELGITQEKMKDAKNELLTRNFNSLDELAKFLNPDSTISLASYEDELSEELQSAKLYHETLETLSKLSENGVKLGLISNLATPYKQPFFSLGLQDYFQSVIFSCDVQLKKPDTRIYLLSALHLGVNHENILMIGDNFYCDVQGPSSTGMSAMLLDRSGSSQPSIASLKEVFSLLL